MGSRKFLEPAIHKIIDKNMGIINIKSDVNTLKSDVNTLKSDVSILKSDVNILKSDVNTLRQDLLDCRTHLEILIENTRIEMRGFFGEILEQLKGFNQMKEKSDRIDDHEYRIRTLEHVVQGKSP